MASEPIRQESDQIHLRKRGRIAGTDRCSRCAGGPEAHALGTAWADDRLRASVSAGRRCAAAFAHPDRRRIRNRRSDAADLRYTLDLFARLAGACAHDRGGVAGVLRLEADVSAQARSRRHRSRKGGEAAQRLPLRSSAARGRSQQSARGQRSDGVARQDAGRQSRSCLKDAARRPHGRSLSLGGQRPSRNRQKSSCSNLNACNGKSTIRSRAHGLQLRGPCLALSRPWRPPSATSSPP